MLGLLGTLAGVLSASWSVSQPKLLSRAMASALSCRAFAEATAVPVALTPAVRWAGAGQRGGRLPGSFLFASVLGAIMTLFPAFDVCSSLTSFKDFFSLVEIA